MALPKTFMAMMLCALCALFCGSVTARVALEEASVSGSGSALTSAELATLVADVRTAVADNAALAALFADSSLNNLKSLSLADAEARVIAVLSTDSSDSASGSSVNASSDTTGSSTGSSATVPKSSDAYKTAATSGVVVLVAAAVSYRLQ